MWFDLVCVPQNGGVIAEREISRQALIFKNALHAVAWMNEITCLDPIKALLQWISLGLLQFPQDSQEEIFRRKLIDDCWAELHNNQTGLVMSNSLVISQNALDANHWSSSLWTLQEVCLRPDMWFLDKDFNYLSIEEGISISISGMTAIFSAFQSSFQYSGSSLGHFLTDLGPLELSSHPAWYESQFWLYLTGLDKLNGMTQCDILALGDRRYCQERRAEAIMSAIGATGWHNTACSVETVLDKYPLSFVREICKLDPAQFFGSYVKSKIQPIELHPDPRAPPLDQPDPDLEDDEDDMDNVEEGSMLPFSKGPAFYVRFGAFEVSLLPHRSISSWSILASGAVEIAEACILSSAEIAASTRSAEKTLPLGAMIAGVPHRNARRLSHEQGLEAPFSIDLHDFMRTRDWPAYAIVVQHRTSAKPDASIIVKGVVMREQLPVGSDILDSRVRKFAKVGMFAALIKGRPAALPKTVVVNWIVE